METKLLGNTHIVGGGPEMLPTVLSFLAGQGIPTKGNPDLYVRVYKNFGIDEARGLRERASLRALRQTQGKRRVFVVAAASINREAQNALLKTLEEPPGNALFIFIVPAPHMLLPTLRSRLQFLIFEREKEQESIVDPKQFLAASPQKRLDLLKPLLEKGEDDTRDLGAILGFLASLELVLAEKPGREGIATLYRARKYMTDKGALVKPLLEQVALLVPRV